MIIEMINWYEIGFPIKVLVNLNDVVTDNLCYGVAEIYCKDKIVYEIKREAIIPNDMNDIANYDNILNYSALRFLLMSYCLEWLEKNRKYYDFKIKEYKVKTNVGL